jgi:mono/diheme cytochrome c family protein
MPFPFLKKFAAIGLVHLLASLLHAVEVPQDSPRTWVDATGKFQIEAKFIRFADGNVHLQRSSDSSELAIPLSALSQVDQGFLRDLLSKQANPYRSWADKTGQFQIQARFLNLSDGIVRLHRLDGKEIKLPLEGLGQVDKDYVHALLSVAAVASEHLVSQTAQDGPDDLEFQAKLILQEHCIRCHGANKQKGGLRLDSRGATLGGGDSGRVLVPGNASKSLVYDLVILDEDNQYRMPPKGPLLTAKQQAVLKDWINAGAPWSGQLQEKDGQHDQDDKVIDSSYRGQLLAYPSLVKQHSRQIDTLMLLWFRREGETQGRLVSDEVFLRRAYLDIGGRIPSLLEYEEYMASAKPDKRDRLIHSLLDSPAFVSHTQNLWLHALRVKQGHPKLNSDTYMARLHNAIQGNMPFDEFALEEIIQASRHIGIEASLNNEYVQPFPELFRSYSGQELPSKGEGLKDASSLENLAKWATSRDNHMFNKTIVNRLWARVFGVPLVGSLDDISEREMGPNPRLTAYLIQFMRRIEYDQKLFLEVLFKTETYQREAYPIPNLGEMPMGAPVVKHLSPEQIRNSIVTLRDGDPDKLLTQIHMTPESWMDVNANKREASSSFLGVFGRAGLEVTKDRGQEVARPVDAKSKGQLENRPVSELARRLRESSGLDAQTISWAYHAILARTPTPKEMEQVIQNLAESPDPMPDLVWFLLNTTEFKLKQ